MYLLKLISYLLLMLSLETLATTIPKQDNRPLSKIAAGSTDATKLFASAVEFRKKSNAQIVRSLYLDVNSNLSMPERLDHLSAQFLGKPYLLGSLGEGEESRYDQFPRCRFDAFDCDTYVTTVLALALANTEEGFYRCLEKIRYHQGQVTFVNRNHFTDLDWNKNNQEQYFIKDITSSFKNKNQQPLAKTATTLIDKPSWYQHFTIEHIRLTSNNKEEQVKRLAELKAEGAKLAKTISHLSYIPLIDIVPTHGKTDDAFFAQIPNGAIIEIVRPNWDIKKHIGTNLNISHLGFAFWKKGTLFFRQASSQYGHVVEIPLIDYLRKAGNNPTIQGINIEVVVPRKPLSKDCVSHFQ